MLRTAEKKADGERKVERKVRKGTRREFEKVRTRMKEERDRAVETAKAIEARTNR